MKNIVQSFSDIHLNALQSILTPFVYLNDRFECLFANTAFCKLFDAGNKLITAQSQAKEYFTGEYFIAQEEAPSIFSLVPTLLNENTSIESFKTLLATAKEKGVCEFFCYHEDIQKNTRKLDIVLHYISYEGHDIFSCQMKDYMQQLHEDSMQQYERDKIILDSLPIAASYWNEDLEIIACNEALLSLFKVANLETYKAKFKSFFPNQLNNIPGCKSNVQHLIKDTFTKGYMRIDFERLDSEGNKLYLDSSSVCFEQAGKRYVAVYTIDLTSIKKHDAELEEANARANLMLNSFPVGATLWDTTLKIIDCNLEVVNLLGYASKEDYLNYANTIIADALPVGREYYKDFFDLIARVFETGYAKIEWTTKHKNGHYIPVELIAMRVKHHTEDVVVAYTRDITLKRKLFQEIQAANARSQVMLNTFPMGANFWNKDLQIIDCNLEMVKLAGFNSKEEYLERVGKASKSSAEEYGYISKIHEIVKRASVTGYEKFEWVTRHKDGYDIPVERTFIRVQNGKGEDCVIGYMRDLREHNKMITELMEAYENLRNMKELAEKNANIKGEFLAHMSHEIRTPMNGILGLIHLLLNSNSKEQHKIYAEKALESAKHLFRVMNDILDLSSFEKGVVKMENTAFKIQDVCQHVIDLFEPKAQEKGLNFIVTYEKEAKTKLFGDPMRLKQALFNLMSNAIKFTEKGAIHLDVQEKDKSDTQATYLFKMSDTGIGIKEEQISNLFTAFSQGEAFITRKYEGTGLGLLLTKKIVDAMDGEIWVDSVYGKYTNFYLSVSFDLFETHKLEERAFNVGYDRYQVPKEILNSNTSKNIKVLIVEDNKINQLVTRELLKKHKYTTAIAENGKEALDILEVEHFDIVLMDIQMPVMDGITATKEIRKKEKLKDLPIVAVSAHIMEGDIAMCRDVGMNEHVKKPLSPPELLRAIESCLQ